jgi:hypothetical protein
LVNEVVAVVVAGGAPPHPEASAAVAKPMHAPITAARAAGVVRNVSISEEGPVDGRMASKR